MFRDLDGKTLTLNFIPLSWKVKQLRQKLGEEKALEVEYYRFLWGGKQLDDGISIPIYIIHGPLELTFGHRENAGRVRATERMFAAVLFFTRTLWN